MEEQKRELKERPGQEIDEYYEKIKTGLNKSLKIDVIGRIMKKKKAELSEIFIMFLHSCQIYVIYRVHLFFVIPRRYRGKR